MLRLSEVKAFVAVLMIVVTGYSLAAQPLLRKVLFLGNSYTYVNNLPGITAALAHSSGDSLYFESNSPGGYTLGWQPVAHSTNPVSLERIRAIDWDFVVLQEQSQTPAISRLRDSCMYPASVILHDSVKSAHLCSRVLFYLTWGRRFGGIQCFEPNYCSPNFAGFDQMQDSITVAYKGIADSVAGWIAPVGEAWRFILHNTAMVLHSDDNSHPNLNGSYLAACVFYSVIFGKSPVGLTFTAGLDPDSALILQQAADSITFGYAQQWNLYNDEPSANFTLTTAEYTLITQNLSAGATSWLWDFGDGQTSALFEPFHVYASTGSYTVKLKACNDCFCDSVAESISITTLKIPRPGYAAGSIRLAWGNEAGMLRLVNFYGKGTLHLFDLTGRKTGTIPVTEGNAGPLSKPDGMLLWILISDSGEVLQRGKIVN